MHNQITRREFTKTAALATTATVIGVGGAGAGEYDTASVLNYNQNMEYRRLGKTGLMVSAVCMGGHWKRVAGVLGRDIKATGYSKGDEQLTNDAEFLRNRHDILSKAIDSGINYVDACTGPEVMAYSKVLAGRRDKIYLGYSWHLRESRFKEYRTAKALIQGLDESFRETGLEYVDLWRITLPEQGVKDVGELTALEEGTMRGLEEAKKQGKARFAGISTHNRTWLASMIKRYDVLDATLSPYTAASKRLPHDSLFDVLQERDVGFFGIKPFADNSLFVGDSSPNSPQREQDDRRARMALRYILGNPAISAPIPGLITEHQVDNAVRAVAERRELDLAEKAELQEFSKHVWANLRPSHAWLRDWEYV
ncbi:MAG: aldo/keto reductase [bacterium]|nr:aldo/keto reductase [bacterium]